jgi:hypothetical protein
VGLSSTQLKDLADLKRRGILQNGQAIIEIGAQQLSPDFLRSAAAISELYALFDRPVPASLEATNVAASAGGIEAQPDDAPSSREFWETLGFSYAAIDFDGHRDSFALDLNKDSVPADMRGKFCLVINAGTTEHVANQDNAFRVMHDLSSVGGIMMHAVPAGGMMNHGLVNYNPKFFWHLCRENGYEVIALQTVSPYAATLVPQNILDSNKQFGRYDNDVTGVMVPDIFVLANLRKLNDSPFVTPLDVPIDLKRRS